MKGQGLLRRLGFALSGLALAFCRERSVRTHLLAGAAVLVVLLLLRPPAVWWAIAVLVVGLVLVAELLNTAIEALADRLHPERHPEIRVVKDVAAAAVLLASIAALLIAIIFLLR